MAPEQCRGAGSIDHRADLYALGCVAYEMLCGVPPFVTEGAGDLIARHLYFQPQPLRAHRPDLRVEVEAFVLSLLQKDPGARPSTALDVVHAVDRLAAAAPTIALQSDRMSAAMPVVRPATLDTTLSGAATMSAAARPAPGRAGSRSLRVRLLAGVATAGIVLLIVILWPRAAQDEVPASQPERAHPAVAGSAAHAATGGPAGAPGSGGEIVSRPAPPTRSADPKPQPPSSERAPDSAPGPAPGPAVEPAPAHATSDGSGGEAPPKPSPGDAAAPSAVSKPTDLARRSDVKDPSTAARPTDQDKAAAAAKPGGATKEAAASKPAGGCARGAFAAVLSAHTPGEAAVQAALARLQRCKPTMDPAVYADIQRRLIAKL